MVSSCSKMFSTRSMEIWVGLFVVFAIVAFAFMVFRVSGISDPARSGYTVSAVFDDTSGLSPRAKVTMAGVVIGRVTEISLDTETQRSIVKMRLDRDIDFLTTDTSATIFTSGLLGDKYVGLVSGGEEELLTEGGVIEFTQSSLILENLIGQFLLNIARD